MPSQPISLRRILILIAAAAALVLGYSAASTAIDFGPPATEDHATPAENPAEAGPGTGVVEIDEARLIAGLAAYKEAGCRGCHGWAANGVREGPQPQGPSLRASLLPIEFIRVTVACGRPDSPMPYFWRDAYRRDSTECYGQTGADLGDLAPSRGAARFSDEEIDDLAYYLEFYVKGLGEITFEECEFFFGEGNARCDFYR
jgi:hypothetical protein